MVSYVELHNPPFKHVIPDVQVERYWQFKPVYPFGQQHIDWLVRQNPPFWHDLEHCNDVWCFEQSLPDQPGEHIFSPVIELQVYELVQSSFGIHWIEHCLP